MVSALALGRFGRLEPAGEHAAGRRRSASSPSTLVPFLVYPPNPPAVGNADTIGYRTALYFALLAISLIAAVTAVLVGRRLAARFGGWHAALVAAAGYLVVLLVGDGAAAALQRGAGRLPGARCCSASAGPASSPSSPCGAVLGVVLAELVGRLAPRRGRGPPTGAAVGLAVDRCGAPPAGGVGAGAGARLAALAKPTGALGRLEDAGRLAGRPARAPAHPARPTTSARWCSPATTGSPLAGVSAYPREVTAAMVRAFVAGLAGVSVLARQHGVRAAGARPRRRRRPRPTLPGEVGALQDPRGRPARSTSRTR